MSLRDWRPRRIAGVSLLWLVGLLGAAIVRAVYTAREVQRNDSSAELYIAVHVPGGMGVVVGPPLLLLVTWWWLRRTQRAR